MNENVFRADPHNIMHINTNKHSHSKHEQNVYHMTSYITKFITILFFMV